MGLFDTIFVDYPLPPGYEYLQSNDFQTKDLDNWMIEFHITGTGRLVKRVYDLRDMTPAEIDEDRVFWEGIAAKTKTKGPLPAILSGDEEPHQVQADTYTDEDQEYHGDIHFYEWDDNKHEMIDFIARFTNGTLEWIKNVTQEQLKVQRFEI